MEIGYARVSTDEQTLDLQMDALKSAGCEKIFTDKGISGSKTDRPGLNEALEYARNGDRITVWRLDRLGRSLPHLIKVTGELGDRGVDFRSLKETIDTASATGKLLFHVMAALTEFERDLIIERTHAGLAAARARGRNGGRPPKLTKDQIAIIHDSHHKISPVALAKSFNVSRATIYRAIEALKNVE